MGARDTYSYPGIVYAIANISTTLLKAVASMAASFGHIYYLNIEVLCYK